MILSDIEIKVLLPELSFATEDKSQPFSPERQVQTCSIDLCLSAVFWIARDKKVIDLRRSHSLKIAPRHKWRKSVLEPGECITLGPGEMILGRTSELFSIPPGVAGQIFGRSSFARLGLMVHCSDGFINPGWRGHMPLQLINQSASPIKIIPYLPICQLVLTRLEVKPEKPYGHKELQSKYMDDDGGPSYWWRDERIEALHRRLGECNVAPAIERRVIEIMGMQEIGVIERFQSDLDKMKVVDLESADAMLMTFCKNEDRRQFWAKLIRNGLIYQAPLITIGGVTNAVFADKVTFWTWLFIIGVIISLPVAFFSYCHDASGYFGTKELALEQKRNQIEGNNR